MIRTRKIMLFVAALLVVMSASLQAYVLTETTFVQADVDNGTIAFDPTDTFQVALGLPGVTSTLGASVWGNGYAAADAVSGSDAGQTFTIGLDGSGSYLDMVFGSKETGYQGGRTLDSIIITTSCATPDRVNYEYYFQYMAYSGGGGDITSAIGGSNTAYVGTQIALTDINIEDIYGIRIWANPACNPPDGQWRAAMVEEVDVNLIPEPATITLLGIGLLALRRRR
jgi:hypothetical protein